MDDKPKMELTPRMEGVLAGICGEVPQSNPYRVHSYYDPWKYEREQWDRGWDWGNKIAAATQGVAILVGDNGD